MPTLKDLNICQIKTSKTLFKYQIRIKINDVYSQCRDVHFMLIMNLISRTLLSVIFIIELRYNENCSIISFPYFQPVSRPSNKNTNPNRTMENLVAVDI